MVVYLTQSHIIIICSVVLRPALLGGRVLSCASVPCAPIFVALFRWHSLGGGVVSCASFPGMPVSNFAFVLLLCLCGFEGFCKGWHRGFSDTELPTSHSLVCLVALSPRTSFLGLPEINIPFASCQRFSAAQESSSGPTKNIYYIYIYIYICQLFPKCI